MHKREFFLQTVPTPVLGHLESNIQQVVVHKLSSTAKSRSIISPDLFWESHGKVCKVLAQGQSLAASLELLTWASCSHIPRGSELFHTCSKSPPGHHSRFRLSEFPSPPSHMTSNSVPPLMFQTLRAGHAFRGVSGPTMSILASESGLRYPPVHPDT
jgi:hypothetical protein